MHANKNTKCVRLVLSENTMLEDLPMELIEHIFIRAITMEVEEMHLAKSVWKEKADLVLSRLRTVCPYWNNFLVTSIFKNELYRTLDRTVVKPIRLEMLHQWPVPCNYIYDVIAFKDELFLHVGIQENVFRTCINVYDRNNMSEVKSVIELSEIKLNSMAACSVSNCLYILSTNGDVLVYRITKQDEHEFSTSPLIRGRWQSCGGLYVHVDGNGSIILSKRHSSEPSVEIFIHDSTGSMQHQISVPSDIYNSGRLIAKSNGNLVLVSFGNQCGSRTKLTEIDINCTILRQYQSSLYASDFVCNVDRVGRILIVDQVNEFELVDQEFNVLSVTGLQLDTKMFWIYPILKYNSERNEVVTVLLDNDMILGIRSFVSIFHFKEE